MREGGLDAPVRHFIDWESDDFTDPQLVNSELRRVFDICHGCRRCFNLCDSFPTLFDMIDDSETGELDSVPDEEFKKVVDGCTLCDMCFMTKCPYVPPHEFNLDFPHLMLRYRAMEFDQGKVGFVEKEITKTDRNGRLASKLAVLVNWVSSVDKTFFRLILKWMLNIHVKAKLPKFNWTGFSALSSPGKEVEDGRVNRKVAIYQTCFVEYNNPKIGLAAEQVLKKNGIKVVNVYPECCGMPQLEHGDIKSVADKAKKIASELVKWIDDGYDIVTLVPSCSLMLKFEWPLLLPNEQLISKLSKATYDISEYVVDVCGKEAMEKGLTKIEGGVTLHQACHARAQNMGPKSLEMLRFIPETEVQVVERCSGHGGTWGFMNNNFETAIKQGKPVVKKITETQTSNVVSECPLARDHIIQGLEATSDDDSDKIVNDISHPIELLAKSYGK